MKKSELKELIMECMIEVMNDNYYNTYNDDEYYDEDAKGTIKKGLAALTAGAMIGAGAGRISSNKAHIRANNKYRSPFKYSISYEESKNGHIIKDDVEFGIHDGTLYRIMYINNNTSCTDIVIPDGVKVIYNGVFENNDHIKSVVIPDSVITIEDDAFFGCKKLESVKIGNSVTSIGDHAFYGCRKLTNITIGDSVAKIGDTAFGDCESLKEITIPDSGRSLGVGAFTGCKNLKLISIPKSFHMNDNSLDKHNDTIIRRRWQK